MAGQLHRGRSHRGAGAHLSRMGLLRTSKRSAVLPRPPCSKQLSGLAPGRSGPSSAPGRDHPTVLRDEAPPEVRAIEVDAPDGFVHSPQLGQGDRRSDVRRCDVRDLELDADTRHRIAHDPRMIERQLTPSADHLGLRHQGGICCVRARHDRTHLTKHREVRDRHDVHPRVAPGIAVGREPRPPRHGKDKHPAADSLPGRLRNHQRCALREPENKHEVEVEFERLGDLPLTHLGAEPGCPVALTICLEKSGPRAFVGGGRVSEAPGRCPQTGGRGALADCSAGGSPPRRIGHLANLRAAS